MRRCSTLMLGVVCSIGCAGTEVDPLGEDLRGDNGLLTLEVGDELSLSVMPLGTPVEVASSADLRESIVAMRIHLAAGDTVALLMSSTSATLDPYLTVKDADGLVVDVSDDQAFLSTLGPRDAAIALTASVSASFFVFASGGAHLDSGGSFVLRAVAMPDPKVNLSKRAPDQSTWMNELWTMEADLQRFWEAGAVSETNEGTLHNTGDLQGVLLEERSRVAPLVELGNAARKRLYQTLAEYNGQRGGTSDSLAQALAPLYRATRAGRDLSL